MSPHPDSRMKWPQWLDKASSASKRVDKVGFTGSRNGMTPEQRLVLGLIIDALEAKEFRHGDCIGSDNQAARIAKDFGLFVVGHPPTDDTQRAFFPNDLTLEPKEFLVRDHDIVDASDVLVGAPSGFKEVLRSGTWATIRYARKTNQPYIIVWPNGLIDDHWEEGILEESRDESN